LSEATAEVGRKLIQPGRGARDEHYQSAGVKQVRNKPNMSQERTARLFRIKHVYTTHITKRVEQVLHVNDYCI
jgi:hypothetical protein